MERFPEAWMMQILEGPLVYEDVDYVDCRIIDSSDGYDKKVFVCLLCETGELKSPQSCLEHCCGKKHQRNYKRLEQQQTAWMQEWQVPDSFETTEEFQAEDVPNYFMPFRRWHFGKWDGGLSCQLCGTAAFPNRYAIVEHCETSSRHAIRRNASLYTTHHPEILENPELLQRLQALPLSYQWHVERAMLRYVAAKEWSMASLASKRYEWYQVWQTLHLYETRLRMSLLECAIWKAHMLEWDESTPRFRSLSELDQFLDAHGIDREEFRQSRRETSGVTAIVLAVIPFL